MRCLIKHSRSGKEIFYPTLSRQEDPDKLYPSLAPHIQLNRVGTEDEPTTGEAEEFQSPEEEEH